MGEPLPSGTTHQLLDALRHLLLARHALEEAHVRASLDGLLETVDRRVEPKALERVRAGNNHNVAAGTLAGGDGRADAREERRVLDQLLAPQVSAALLHDLVLEVECGDAG